MSANCSLKSYKIFCNGIFNNLKNYVIELENYFKNSSLYQKIDNYQLELCRIDDNTSYNPHEFKDNNYFYKELKEEYDIFHAFFKKIDEDLNEIIKFDFFPSNKNNICLNLDNNSPSIKENNESNDNTVKISSYINFVNNKKNFDITKLKNNLENRIKFSNDEKDNVNINDDIKKDSQYLNKKQKDRECFLNLMINFIKDILLKCNEIVKNNKDSEIIENQEKNPNYGYFDYLIDINNNENKIKIDDFSLINLNEDIINKFEDAFMKNKDPIFENLDDNSVEEDNFEDYNDEIFNGNSDESKEIKGKKEKAQIDKNTKIDFYYLINIIPKNNLNENIKKKIENKLKVKINPSNALILNNNNKYFIDNFVRSEFFVNLSLEQINDIYLIFKELYENRNIVEYLIKECEIQEDIDLKDISIIKINDKGKTKEEFYPSYGWIEIPLKIREKNANDDSLNHDYNDNEWTFAYHGVGGGLSTNEVKDKLKQKIKNGLEQGKSQTKCNLYDIRRPGKRIGTGVYLTPNIDYIDKYCGKISFNEKKYLVALKVKVKIDKIRQPKDEDIWILFKKYIRLNSILLKKLN